jgi:hypothetical protein
LLCPLSDKRLSELSRSALTRWSFQLQSMNSLQGLELSSTKKETVRQHTDRLEMKSGKMKKPDLGLKQHFGKYC